MSGRVCQIWLVRIVVPSTIAMVLATSVRADQNPTTTEANRQEAPKVKARTHDKSKTGLHSKSHESSPSMERVARPANDLLSGRIEPLKSRLLKERGGNPESEEAIDRGLDWLILHQYYDGSWRFNHVDAPFCQGQCTDSGRHEDVDNCATGMALLALLGSGHTHIQGKYRFQITAGLKYLAAQANPRMSEGDLRGTWLKSESRPMYAQALATLALSEAYGMTGDDQLRPCVEVAANYIVQTQDAGGGWRYQPGQAGDLSVSGWQIMALESARHARIAVPKYTTDRFWGFLNVLELEQGRLYGYRVGDLSARPGITATGLLSRVWLRHDQGQPVKHPTLDSAIGQLISSRPLRNNLYYDYYASQLFLIYDHPKWPEWNAEMRDFLIASQRKDGHFSGSWDPIDSWGSNIGGRLYNTAMATMILEVYYRYLPLYQVGDK